MREPRRAHGLPFPRGSWSDRDGTPVSPPEQWGK
jgi:hypothetical protein